MIEYFLPYKKIILHLTMTTGNSEHSNDFLILKSYSGRDGLNQIRKDIEVKIRSKLFEIETKQELFYEALRHIAPTHESLEKTPESIKVAIDLILRHFKLKGGGASLSKLTDKGLGRVEAKNTEPSDVFEKYILGFNELPVDHLRKMTPQVKEDLIEVNQLVCHYEALPEVRKYLQERRYGKTQKAKTILDFFHRCLIERQKILNFYLEGVYERAIEKSKSSILPFNIPNFFEAWHDFPYEAGKGIFGQVIDYRKIDCASHRVSNINISEMTDAMELYSENKTEFYRQLFGHTTSDELFARIFYHLSLLPTTGNRIKIFEDLKGLFLHENWLAFYAVALPQVEGLFAEMVSSAIPKSKDLTGSLSQKVKRIRPFYSMSTHYLDYYEYDLPNQRNKFSHTGYINDIEVRAYDILTDLNHVLEVFASLENPYVEIVKMIRQKDQYYFPDYPAIASYFELRKKLPIEQLQEIRSEIDSFENNFLKSGCSLEYIFIEAIEDLIRISKETCQLISQVLVFYDVSEEYKLLNEPKLKKQMSKLDVFSKIEILLELNSDKFIALKNLQTFFTGVLSLIYPSDRPFEIEQNFKLWEEHKKVVKWLIDFEKIPTTMK